VLALFAAHITISYNYQKFLYEKRGASKHSTYYKLLLAVFERIL